MRVACLRRCAFGAGRLQTYPAHLCRHRLRFLGFAHPKQAVGRAESTLLACAGPAHERMALPLAPSRGECSACQAARRETRSTDQYRLAPDRQPLGRIIGRKRSRFKTADTQYLQAAIGLTTCVACNCCCLSPVRSTHDVSFAFTILHFLAQHSGIARLGRTKTKRSSDYSTRGSRVSSVPRYGATP